MRIKRKTYTRIKNISMGTIACGCTFGFFTLLIQPKELDKGIVLGIGFGLCCGIRLTED